MSLPGAVTGAPGALLAALMLAMVLTSSSAQTPPAATPRPPASSPAPRAQSDSAIRARVDSAIAASEAERERRIRAAQQAAAADRRRVRRRSPLTSFTMVFYASVVLGAVLGALSAFVSATRNKSPYRGIWIALGTGLGSLVAVGVFGFYMLAAIFFMFVTDPSPLDIFGFVVATLVLAALAAAFAPRR